jgi:hypothetical protein
MAAPAMYRTRTRHSLFVMMVSYLWLHPSRVVPGVGVARSTAGSKRGGQGFAAMTRSCLPNHFHAKGALK